MPLCLVLFMASSMEPIYSQASPQNIVLIKFTSGNSYKGTLYYYTEKPESLTKPFWERVLEYHYLHANETLNGVFLKLVNVTEITIVYSPTPHVIVSWIASNGLNVTPSVIKWKLGTKIPSLMSLLSLTEVYLPQEYIPLKLNFSAETQPVLSENNTYLVKLSWEKGVPFTPTAKACFEFIKSLILPSLNVTASQKEFLLHFSFFKLFKCEKQVLLHLTLTSFAPSYKVYSTTLYLPCDTGQPSKWVVKTFPVKELNLSLELNYTWGGEKYHITKKFFQRVKVNLPPYLTATLTPSVINAESHSTVSLILKIKNEGLSEAKSIDLQPVLPSEITITYGTSPKTNLGVNESSTVPINLHLPGEGVYSFSVNVTYLDNMNNQYSVESNQVVLNVTSRSFIKSLLNMFSTLKTLLVLLLLLIAAIIGIYFYKKVKGKPKLG